MSDWIPIDFEQIEPPSRAQAGGVEINLFWSPYDVPEAVRGYYDRSLDRFVIEFKYIVDEQTTREHESEPVSLRVGKHSARLYAIEVDVNRLKAPSVMLNTFVPETVDELIRKQSKASPKRRDNMDVARKILSQSKEEVFRELSMA